MRITIFLMAFTICFSLCHCGNNISSNKTTNNKSEVNKPFVADLTLLSVTGNLLKNFDETQNWSYASSSQTGKHQKTDKRNFLRHSIDSIFYHIRLKPSISAPVTKGFSIFKISDDSLACNSGNVSSNDYKIRLPNIGEMELYFQCGEIPLILPRAENYNFQHDCKEYGNLVLINIKSRKTKILNVYGRFNSEEDSHSRYFYIERNTINVYQEDNYESDISFEKIYSIQIKDFEHIIVTKFNNGTKL